MLKKNFKINKEIYKEEIILSAIEDFEEVGDIVLEKDEVIISGTTQEEIDEIFNELMNYVIGLINE